MSSDKLKPFIMPGIIAVITAVILTAWNTFRPAMISEHIADIEDLGKHDEHIESALEEVAGLVKGIDTRWACYNLTVKIDQLVALPEKTPLDIEHIRRAREKTDAKGCARYYDE